MSLICNFKLHSAEEIQGALLNWPMIQTLFAKFIERNSEAVCCPYTRHFQPLSKNIPNGIKWEPNIEWEMWQGREKLGLTFVKK